MPRISLRQLLLFVAAIALAIVSLKYATRWWQVAVGLVLLLSFFAAVIAAIFERGPRQAFAIGFAVVVFGYVLMLINGRQSVSTGDSILSYEELHGTGYLPTTVALGEFYDILFRPGAVRTARPTPGSPPQMNFVIIGHTWLALLFGYLGGRFAQFLYLRRIRELSPSGKP